MKEPAPLSTRPGARLSGTVFALGVASFFNDIGSEMSFPLLSVFILSIGGGPTFLGVVEGIADATASCFKLLAGYAADRIARAKPLVLLGYGLPCSVRPLLALVMAPWQVLAIRVTDRVGKGLRTAPRDALIAGSMPSTDSGRAFGFHRAMDHAGGVIGPLLATALLSAGLTIRQVFLAALVPSVLALVAVSRVKEPPRAALETLAARPGALRASLPRSFRGYLAIIALFGLANSSDAFLLLRASEIGVSTASLPLLWTVLHISRMVCTYLGGRLADRFPRARVISAGWLVFAGCYLGMGLAQDAWLVWTLFVVYGVHAGLCEPAERALIHELAPESARGRAFGLFHGVVGACAIPAGLLTGLVWQQWSARSALWLAAGVALVAALALAVWERRAAISNAPPA